MATLVQLDRISKSYRSDNQTLPVLKRVSLEVKQGDLLAIMGKSGSGKSTLLHIIGLLDRPTSGNVSVADETISHKTPSSKLALLRRQNIGFIFQSFNLIPRLTAASNVELPMVYSRRPNRRERARELLDLVGLGLRTQHRPNQLSGGEQQRVAIARALANEPKLLLADEPTGNLDTKTGSQIMKLLRELHRKGLTIVVVSHDRDVVSQANRIIKLQDGKIIK